MNTKFDYWVKELLYICYYLLLCEPISTVKYY